MLVLQCIVVMAQFFFHVSKAIDDNRIPILSEVALVL